MSILNEHIISMFESLISEDLDNRHIKRIEDVICGEQSFWIECIDQDGKEWRFEYTLR